MSVEVVGLILEFVMPSWKTIVVASEVAHVWREAARSDYIWRKVCNAFAVDITLNPKSATLLQVFKNHVIHYGASIVDDYRLIKKISARLKNLLQNSQILAPLKPPCPWEDLCSRSMEKEWDLNINTATKAEIQLALFYHLFSSGQDMSWVYRRNGFGGLGVFGSFQCYHDLYSAFLLEESEVHEDAFNYSEDQPSEVNRVVVFAKSTRDDQYGIVVSGSDLLMGHVIRFAPEADYHRMAIPEGTVPYFDLGRFDEFMDKFVCQLECSQRNMIQGAPSAIENSGPTTSVATTQGIEISVSAFFMLSEARFCYRITMKYKPEECPYTSVQLTRRKWLFKRKLTQPSMFEGSGVIGAYPILSASNPVFEYCSYSEGGPVEHESLAGSGTNDALTLDNPVTSMEGAMVFVPGTIANPTGQEFDALVSPVHFQLPSLL